MVNHSLENRVSGLYFVQIYGHNLELNPIGRITLRKFIVLAFDTQMGRHPKDDEWKITFFSRKTKSIIVKKKKKIKKAKR